MWQSNRGSSLASRVGCAALIISLAVVNGCSTYQTSGDFFFVSNDGAHMPVWVRGNVSSGVFLINLHGGPGGSSMIATLVPAMQELISRRGASRRPCDSGTVGSRAPTIAPP